MTVGVDETREDGLASTVDDLAGLLERVIDADFLARPDRGDPVSHHCHGTVVDDPAIGIHAEDAPARQNQVSAHGLPSAVPR